MSRHVTPLSIRFWPKVAVATWGECWAWTRYCDRNGYGRVNIGQGQVDWVHRVAYALVYGAVPAGLEVRHVCDTPPCCNPLHLIIGTHAENMADMARRGRARGGPGQPHSVLTKTRRPGWQDGTKNTQAKLTEQDVLAIRAVPAFWGINSALARKYGVTSSCVENVRNGRNWKHLL